jgi:uncharacterized membrane protein YccC
VLPLAALIFNVLQRSFVRAGGTGDLRAIQNLVLAILVLAAYGAILILITPFMASYLVMNLTLLVGIFIFGFLTARSPGLTFWALLTILGISTFVGLNAQVPVPSSTIIDSILGLMLGIAIATGVGRLIWPVLPQRLLRDDLVAFFRQLKALSERDQPMEKIQTQLALLPIEALQAVNRIRMRYFTEQQRSQFELLIRALSGLATHRTALATRLIGFPAELHALLRAEFEQLEIEFGQILDAFADCFRKGDCTREFPTVRGALDGMRQRVDQIRRERILYTESLDAPLRLVEVVSRYQTIGEVLEECTGLIKSLNLHRYWGDYAL